MNLTIITPATNHPQLPRCVESVHKNNISSCHLVIGDGYETLYNNLTLPYNTGKEHGKVKYFGHRIYSAMSFLVNTQWLYFLDEDNWLADDFAEKIAPHLSSNAPAITFRRKIFTENGDFVCLDDFESVPSNNFADTGCVLWNTRFYAERIAYLAYQPMAQDFIMYRKLLHVAGKPFHLDEYLLHYTSPNKNLNFFNSRGTQL